MKIILSAIICIFFCAMISCSKDWLDAKPDKKIVVPESPIDLQGLLDNINVMTFLNPISGELASDLHYVKDATYSSQRKSNRTDAYIWAKTVRHENVSDWDAAYAKILVDNVVLAGIAKISTPDVNSKAERNDIKGQALFHRAFVFLGLLQIYAPQYDESTADKDLGIPLRISADLSQPTRRNTVKEGYHQVLRDLKEACNLLPAEPRYLTRGSKAAVYALLSRVYLYMGDYQSSLSYADSCLNMNNSLLDYNQVSPSQTYIGRYNTEVIYHANFTPSFFTSGAMIDSIFYESYDNNDLRKTRFFKKNSSGAILFKGNYESVTSVLFCGLATDEVYLTRAECLARKGKTVESISTLNTLRKSRWNNTIIYPEITASNPEEALILTLEERKKELLLRGSRWMDLRRLNKDPRFSRTLTKTVNGQNYTLEPNSPKYTFPVPDDIREATGIQQNPGWD